MIKKQKDIQNYTIIIIINICDHDAAHPKKHASKLCLKILIDTFDWLISIEIYLLKCS